MVHYFNSLIAKGRGALKSLENIFSPDRTVTKRSCPKQPSLSAVSTWELQEMTVTLAGWPKKKRRDINDHTARTPRKSLKATCPGTTNLHMLRNHGDSTEILCTIVSGGRFGQGHV